MSELGAGTRGASLGFDAMIIASYKHNQKFFKKLKPEFIQHENHRLFEDVKTPVAKRLDGIFKVYKRMEAKIQEVVFDGDFPIVISGDHSNAGGTIAGLKRAFPDDRIGVVWIDAHADLHSPYTSPSGNVHGMPLTTALSEDNLDCKIVKVPEDTAKLWDALKGESQRILHEDLIFMGLRDYEKPEEYLLIRHKIPNIKVGDYRENGLDWAMQRLEKRLENCTRIYISFDVDSMDPKVSRGTGTPVPGGFMPNEIHEILDKLLDDPRVCCFELTEVNPVLDDKGNAMAETAFDILQGVLAKLKPRFQK